MATSSATASSLRAAARSARTCRLDTHRRHCLPLRGRTWVWPTTSPTSDKPSEEKLEELEEEIEKARREGEEVAHGSYYEGDEPMFVDSGEEARKDKSETGADSKSDDQQIAP